MSESPRILYCHCSYAQVVPQEVKAGVLRKLCQSGAGFDAVADLCELSARRDPSLAELARGPVKIAACFPRAVRWLFAAAQAPLVPDQAQVLNMRVQSVDEIVSALLDEPLQPNVDSPSAAPPAEAADARPSDPTSTSTSTPLPSAP